MSTHRQAAKSTQAGVPRVCPGGEHVFMDSGLSGSEMAHQGVMGLTLLVMAIEGVKFPELGLANRPGNTRAQKLPRQTEGSVRLFG